MNNENKINFQNFEIITGEIEKIGFIARIDRITARAKFGRKVVANYRFKTVEGRDNYVVKFMLDNDKRNTEKEQQKSKIRAIRDNFVNPFKVGEVFYDSWGYEQTNIDFYQIVEVKNKSVVIRKIGQIYDKCTGWASETVKPNVDDFIGEPMTKIVVLDRSGSPRINGYRGRLHSYDMERKEGLHQSHYA